MNIALVTPYGDVYSQDRIFDSKACKIGANLLEPGIALKEFFKDKGDEYHTVDYFDFDKIDVIIFQDINKDSLLTASNPVDFIKYILKAKWKKDYLKKIAFREKSLKSILILQEPKVVFPNGYKKDIQKLFDYVLTWDDKLVDNSKFFKFQYPQVVPEKIYCEDFGNKKLISLFASNKKGIGSEELYSKRYEFIEYAEKNNLEFDLYGAGWDKEKFKCYKGFVEDKHSVQSKYKFSLCYENMLSNNGYITEKIFDCFFSGTVPVYLGAANIENYIPKGAYIDKREYESVESLVYYISNMQEEEYKTYVEAAQKYIRSSSFEKEFSVRSYIERMTKLVYR